MSYPQGPGPYPPPPGYGAPGPGYYPQGPGPYQSPPQTPKKKGRGCLYAAGGVLVIMIAARLFPSQPAVTNSTATRPSSAPMTAPDPVPAAAPAVVTDTAPRSAEVQADREDLVWITKEDQVGALTEAQLDQAMRLVVDGDRTAFDELIASNTGVFLVKPNLRVNLVQVGGLINGHVKVRVRGTTTEFWVYRSALRQP